MGWILVTGAAKGLGAQICKELADSGHDIVVHYRNSEREAKALVLELKKRKVRAECLKGDFSSLASLDEFIKEYLNRFEETDGLVYNIGNYVLGTSLETDPSMMQDLLHVNVTAPLVLIQAVLPSIKQKGGSIVKIGMAGCEAPRANTHASVYNLTKLALYQQMISLAKELAPHKVRVNMVSPGYLERSIDLPEQSLPMGRPAMAEEVARVVAFMMDEKNGYITGQNINVAGGVRL